MFSPPLKQTSCHSGCLGSHLLVKASLGTEKPRLKFHIVLLCPLPGCRAAAPEQVWVCRAAAALWEELSRTEEKWSTEGIQPYTKFTALFIQKQSAHHLQETNIHTGGTANTDTHLYTFSFKTLQGEEQTPFLRCSSMGPTITLSGAPLHRFCPARTQKLRPQRCHPSTKSTLLQVQLYPPCIIPFLWAQWEFCH